MINNTIDSSEDVDNAFLKTRFLDIPQRLEVLKKIENDKRLKFIRVCWVDVANKIRCKSVNTRWLLEHRDNFFNVTVTNACMSFKAFEDAIVQEALPPNSGFGEVFLVPDWDSFTRHPSNPAYAQMFGSFYTVPKVETNAQGQSTTTHQRPLLAPWNLCPRNALKSAIDRLFANGQFTAKGSFEEEFYLIPREKNLQPTVNDLVWRDNSTFASCYSLDVYSDVLEKITDALELQGVPVEQLIKESGPGQFEITVPYTDILIACDRHEIIRQTVHSVAYECGFIASFIPRIYDNAAGNGCHAHLSLWKDGKNIIPDVSNPNQSGISNVGCKFIAGVIGHAKALTGLFNTTKNSFTRLKPNCWSGSNITWGLDNKEAFIRVPTSPMSAIKGNTNFEIKTLDHTANVYLAMAAVIHSGLDGIVNDVPIPLHTSLNPCTLSQEERTKLGIDVLPSNLITALEYLKKDQELVKNLGEDLVRAYTSVKLAEDKCLSSLTDEEIKLKLLELY
ncbi:hypothetical protein CYY_004845 [Polysphondylium violaceum]|uniref:GS catalytic domain-containing protein n=1 Tax=Polysphondylium violaceum TaxID=133409 RepID=A0A8J4PW56_9MYCE|nr:hypothetical protein CYY_004845 [Polysphondylium violaceum]